MAQLYQAESKSRKVFYSALAIRKGQPTANEASLKRALRTKGERKIGREEEEEVEQVIGRSEVQSRYKFERIA